MFDFWNFITSKRRLTQFVRVPPYEILVFPTNFIFSRRNQITLRGKKCTALFQTHNWEKSSFSISSYAYLHRYTQIDGGHNVPPMAKKGLIIMLMHSKYYVWIKIKTLNTVWLYVEKLSLQRKVQICKDHICGLVYLIRANAWVKHNTRYCLR